MIDIEFLRSNADAVKQAVEDRGLTDVDVDALVRADTAWREKTADVEELRHEHRTLSERVPRLRGTDRERALETLRAAAEQLDAAERDLRDTAERRLALWHRIPNIPLAGVPRGRNASGNVVKETPTRLPDYDFPVRDYLDIGAHLGIIDTEAATRASGARFGALVGDGARIAFALVRHALDVLSREGFTPVLPPVLIKEEGMRAMGYLDRGADEVYRTQDDLLLVGTSEQSVGAMHAGVTFEEAELPKRFVAFSSCFRREAGSHGRDVRGILRVHQFEKVEMFSFCRPDRSAEELATLNGLQKRLMDAIGLAYRVVDLCTGDLGFAAAATVDLETWFPARGSFIETHSASSTTDFQTRRLETKFRTRKGRTALVHAVNGTAFAIQRTVAALLEVHQTSDGSVRIPDVLRPALGNRDTLRA